MTAVLFIILVSFAQAQNFLVINDLHYMPNASYSCSIGSCLNLGMFSEDSPLSLIELILDEAVTKGKPDAILISGDFI